MNRESVKLVLDFLAQASGLAVVLFGPAGVESASPAAARLLGLPENKPAGLAPADLLDPPPPDLPPGRTAAFRTRAKSPDRAGQTITGQALGLAASQVWVFQTDPFSQLGALVAGMTHNLAGPLSVIRSSAEIMDLLLTKALAESPAVAEVVAAWPESARRGCHLVLEEVDELSQVIRDLLAKIQGEAVALEQPLDLNEILRREVAMLNHDLRFKHAIACQLDLAADLPPIRGLYSDFSQSFRNLLTNAGEAMLESPVKELTVRTWAGRAGIEVSIHDTGAGLAPEIEDRLFEPFVTTKGDKRAAAGLGLHSVRQLLMPYQVRFEVKSRPGSTEFILRFPPRNGADHDR